MEIFRIKHKRHTGNYQKYDHRYNNIQNYYNHEIIEIDFQLILELVNTIN
jgi:hypothetical protein